ncbi:MAG TPA: DUF533 domain-containing protein [Kofleriaceae bacterium]|nr:DUF533 domain-containing protein [Kofleriaceae bacterium]
MSFLRKMFSGDITADDPRRFIIEAMLGAMEADGDVTEEEMNVLEKNLDEHELFRDLTGEERSRLVDLAADAIRESGGGRDRAAAIARGIPSRGHRLTAYAMACQVCVSDADLPEAEINYLDALQKALGLADDDARQLFEAARSRSGLKTVEEKAAAMREMMPRFVDCMALMAAADGEVHDEEMVGVRAVLRNIPDMAVLTRDELDQAIAVSFERTRGKDAAEELARIAETISDPADRYWTTVYMMIIARADGRTDWREVRFLQSAKKHFALSDGHMDQAMETASMFPAVELGGAAPA